MPLAPAAAVALERLSLQRRSLSSTLLNADAFDRWGPREGPERDAMAAAAASAEQEHQKVTRTLAGLVESTRTTDPSAVVAWASAHIDLLERFIKACGPDDVAKTAVFVANEEITDWRKVIDGTVAFVDENVFYVSVDRTRYAAWFGD
jgi:hypothetical protein